MENVTRNRIFPRWQSFFRSLFSFLKAGSTFLSENTLSDGTFQLQGNSAAPKTIHVWWCSSWMWDGFTPYQSFWKEPHPNSLLMHLCGSCYLQFRNIQIEDLAGVRCVFKYTYHYGHTNFCVPLKAFLTVPIAGTSVGSLRKHDWLTWGTDALL